MKKLFLASSFFIATSAFAQNAQNNPVSFSSDSCKVEFKNDIRIKPSELEIFTADNHTMVFANNNKLIIDGKNVALNHKQHQALADYADSLRTQLPKAANIALDGVKIAGVAIEEVAQAFNINGLDSINALIDDVRLEVENTFYQQGAFVMGKQQFNKFDANFENHYEEQIEKAVESAMMQSMGSIFMALGSELTQTDGEMQSFTERMETLGEKIEEKVELHAKQLEARADTLCDDFSTIAMQEQQLVKIVPAVKDYQLFSYKKHN